jgi:4-amino-4-deoxy-L-arabinose transferase-like glycosyltransferase
LIISLPILETVPGESSPRSRLRFSQHLQIPLILSLLCLFLFFQGIASRDLWASHEARAAQNAQSILLNGDWLMPRLFDGQIEMQKPPGYYWLAAIFGKLNGNVVNEWVVRLPAALAGWLTVLLLALYLQRRGRPIAALLAGSILATAVHYTGTSRIARIDVPLTCAVTAIILMARKVLEEEEWSRWRMLASVGGMGLLSALALLLKGPIGIVIPAAVVAVTALVERRSWWRVLVIGLGVLLVALAVGLPWFLWMNRETEGEFYRVFILYHHFNRAMGGAEALAGHPWWYYGPRFLADFLPWSPLLLWGWWMRRGRGDGDARFGLIWLVVIVVGLSCSRFKRADYLLPAYPGAALYLGCILERWYATVSPVRQKWSRRIWVGVCVSMPVAWLAFDQVKSDKEIALSEQIPFATEIRKVAPAPTPVILFRAEAHLLAFHLGPPLHTLVEGGDLRAELNKPGIHYVVTRVEFFEECQQQLGIPLEVVSRSDHSERAKPYRSLLLFRTKSEPDPWPTPPKD